MMVNGVAPAIPSEIGRTPQNSTDPNAVNLSADFSALLFLVLTIPQAQPAAQNGMPQLPQAAASVGTGAQNICAGAPLLTPQPAGLAEIIPSSQPGVIEQTGATPQQLNAAVGDATKSIPIAAAASQLAPATSVVTEASIAAMVQAAANVNPNTNEANQTVANAAQTTPVSVAANARDDSTSIPLTSQLLQKSLFKPAPGENLEAQQGENKPALGPVANHVTAAHEGASSTHGASEALVVHGDLLEKHDSNEVSDQVSADLHGALRDHSLQPNHISNSMAAAMHNDAPKNTEKASVVNAAPVINRVASEIAVQVRQNKNQALITLDPPDLGSLRIALTLDGDKVQARIVAELHESGNLIQHHLPELKDALQFHRLDLVDVHIDSGNWSGAHNDFTQNFEREFSNGDSWQGAREHTEQQNEAAAIAPSQPARRRPGRVSMWA